MHKLVLHVGRAGLSGVAPHRDTGEIVRGKTGVVLAAIALPSVPLNEIPDIPPQHLLMLKTAADALSDSGLAIRENRERMGAIMGMEFDMEATKFHLRWTAPSLVQDGCAPPLTASRTLGALGSMVANRIAKAFPGLGSCFWGSKLA
jgi:hypothetical protein